MVKGILRADGRIGIRNYIIVAYLVECARHVATEIVLPYRDKGAQVIGFPGCFPNDYAQMMMQKLCTHPNVQAALLVSLGCESFDRFALQKEIADSGRPVKTIVIEHNGGTRSSIEEGKNWLAQRLAEPDALPRKRIEMEDLIIGTICGGSDATSGISGNPAVGMAFDRLGAEGAACIFEETGELIGCEQIMAERAATPQLAQQLVNTVQKAANYYATLGYGSFAAGNAEGGLSTIEEKSMGAYAKSGSATINGIIKPGDIPPTGGLYLMDVVPDGEVRFGFPNISDNAEIAEMIASGAHLILFVTARGSVVGSAISPVIKICANPDTYKNMREDMDINAGRILCGSSLAEVGDEIYHLTQKVINGQRTCSENLGHAEFILTYKQFEPIGPSCLPLAQGGKNG